MKEQFVNRYSISKTLQYSLIPVGRTEEIFNANLMLEKHEKRALAYEKVKGYMDEYHRYFIDTALNSFRLNGVEEYAALYAQPSKSQADLDAMEKMESAMRKQIAKALTKDPSYEELFRDKMIKSTLPEF